MKLELKVILMIALTLLALAFIVGSLSASNSKSTNELYPVSAQIAIESQAEPTYSLVNMGFLVILSIIIMGSIIVAYKLESRKLEIDQLNAIAAIIMAASTPGNAEDIVYADEEPEHVVVPEQPLSPDMFVLSANISVAKNRLIDFVYRSMDTNGPHLGIAKWRALGWSQMELEAMLDLMHSKGLCTKRTAGKVCVYTNTDRSPEYALRKLST